MAISHYFQREIEKLVKKSARSFSALVITGARQVGKSTMLKHLFPKHSYVSLDEMDTRLRAIEDPRGFLMNYKLPLIINEIQEAPSILSYIKNHRR
jgi:predicted AAA+ superfamily ATPase